LILQNNSFTKKLSIGRKTFTYYDLANVCQHFQTSLAKLPYSIRVLLESVARQQDGKIFNEAVLKKLAHWADDKTAGEIPFLPARVILQDLTGVPAVVDLAAMRDAIVQLGGEAREINPNLPVDLVIDHSVQVDCAGNPDALEFNTEKEFVRNKERYQFLKWAQDAFDNFRVIPPESGIIHQVNIEYLSPLVLEKTISGESYLYPDTLEGTDSHTTMINGLGVLGWGVGGIEAEAAMLGEPSFYPLPEVIGVELTGKLPTGVFATDLALRVTQILREAQVVGKFVEYFGAGYETLVLSDRATLANMAPEYGATCGFCPVDSETLHYLEQTGRDPEEIEKIKAYIEANHLFYDPENIPAYDRVIKIDLAEITPSLAGPKRPQDRIELSQMKETFEKELTAPAGNQGFGCPETELVKKAALTFPDGKQETLRTGDIVIAAITSCTNTSNPNVMVAAGLLAKNAAERGLTIAEKVKTSLAPGSRAVTAYLDAGGLTPYLDQLGFETVGYGCTTCIGNSGPLAPEVEKAIKDENLLVTSVLSGNRNFEGRIHPLVKGNYLSSPPLVIAFAIAGTVLIDLDHEALGTDQNGNAVYLKDILPTQKEVADYIDQFITPKLYEKEYQTIYTASTPWNAIKVKPTDRYHWNKDSTYIANPPFFDDLTRALPTIAPLKNLRVLADLGDSVTTDHISPAGAISVDSPAGKYLQEHGLAPKDFNSFGARRGNHEVMMRGTFGNIRIHNKIARGKEGGYTTYWPTGEILSIFDAAEKYKANGQGLIVLAGKDYGMGSSRDWAAKGPALLGVKAVIVESFERIHRSNLIMMGIVPIQFLAGQTAESLGLTGEESFTITLPKTPQINGKVDITATTPEKEIHFQGLLRFDSPADLDYFENQGILPMVIRKKISEKEQSE
jgi:aconitate hydratase